MVVMVTKNLHSYYGSLSNQSISMDWGWTQCITPYEFLIMHHIFCRPLEYHWTFDFTSIILLDFLDACSQQISQLYNLKNHEISNSSFPLTFSLFYYSFNDLSTKFVKNNLFFFPSVFSLSKKK